MMHLPLVRQHLIDPEICIRCNTCEESCKPKAISHDRRNYAVDFSKCNGCGECLPPCPTGAIDSWRRVDRPYDVAAQLLWDELPADVAAPPQELGGDDARLPAGVGTVSDDVARIEAVSSAALGRAKPPWSAAHPYVGLYSEAEPAIATVAGVHRLTGESSESDIRHIVLDFGKQAFPVLEGQSIGILPPGYDETGEPHRVRLYSVASPRDGERPGANNLAITVKRVVVDRAGNPVRGVASNYLCDLQRGDEVEVTGPFGTSFLMPNHPGAKLMMICTGTGAAPMRAMTERRRRRMGRSEGGNILLFFGARRPEELPYFGPLMKLPKELIDVQLAFSRVAGTPKEYVQERMRACGDKVAAMLRDEDAFVYVCGHKRMEEGVMEAFAEVAKEHGMDWEKVRDEMRREGRLHLETY